MEGILYIPPERGTIIGRALWKPRYVVIGGPRDIGSTAPGKSSNTFSPTSQQLQTPASQVPVSRSSDLISLHIYKNKDDLEPVQQHPVSSITDCQVQMVAHRKQGPVLPTLIINISPVTDKMRKRRSSRTTAFTTTRDTALVTLWFRLGDENHAVHKQAVLLEWCRCMQSFIQKPPSVPVNISTSVSSISVGPGGTLSPITPAAPTFTNPFNSPKQRDILGDPSIPQQQQLLRMPVYRPDNDGNGSKLAALNHKASGQTHQTYSSREQRERPVASSESPSLRSRRSDLSHASSTIPSYVPSAYAGGGYANSNTFVPPTFPHRPSDLPSPATTVGDIQCDFPEGWSPSVIGRSSTVSSPIRGRDSVSSQSAGQPFMKPSVTSPMLGSNSSSPPAPRETILDRAFQMRFIPGSERAVPGEEKLSSLARFDALMRDAEERRKQAVTVHSPGIISIQGRALTASASRRLSMGPPSGCDPEEDKEENAKPYEAPKARYDSGAEGDAWEDDDNSTRNSWVHAQDMAMQTQSPQSPLDQAIRMPTKALRALDFIANRHHEGSQARSQPLSNQATSLSSPLLSTHRRPRSRTGVDAISSGIGEYRYFDGRSPETQDMDGYHSSPMQQQLPRPQTGYTLNRPASAQRTHSQPQLAALSLSSHLARRQQQQQYSHPPSPSSLQQQISPTIDTFPAPYKRGGGSTLSGGITVSSPTKHLHRSTTSSVAALPTTSTDDTFSTSSGVGANPAVEKRWSASSSMNRLSFTEFTKRVSSSTTNLLQLQNNNSSSINSNSNNSSNINSRDNGCNILSSEIQVIRAANTGYSDQSPVSQEHGGRPLTSCLETPPRPAGDRCAWRGSIGVFTNEGGFL